MKINKISDFWRQYQYWKNHQVLKLKFLSIKNWQWIYSRGGLTGPPLGSDRVKRLGCSIFIILYAILFEKDIFLHNFVEDIVYMSYIHLVWYHCYIIEMQLVCLVTVINWHAPQPHNTSITQAKQLMLNVFTYLKLLHCNATKSFSFDFIF